MNPKLIKIATGIFLIILLGLGAFLLLDISSKKTSQNNLATSPEYDERDSYEAVISTSKKAEQWSSDARLYSCTGIAPDSTQFGLLGVDEGKFYTWDCIYYSKIKYSILTVQYKEGEVIVDPLKNSEKINEDDLRYENISYPKDYNRVLNSSVIYKSAVANGLDP